jgi:hypothetical protein
MAHDRKEKRRLNVFDLVIIMLLLCLLITFGYRIFVGIDKNNSGGGDSYYVMSFECEKEYDSLLRYLEEGDEVYFVADGKLLGRLYADVDHDNGAIYEIVDDIPTFAEPEMSEDDTDGDESETAIASGKYDNSLQMPSKTPEQTYKSIRLGGQIALNSETVKVKNGGYYFIGETNFTKGSVIDVYTMDAVFTIKIVDVEIIE